MNSWSIGIENVNDARSPFTPEQTLANIYLHEKLVTEHKINPKSLISHADWTPGRKIDPEVIVSYNKKDNKDDIAYMQNSFKN